MCLTKIKQFPVSEDRYFYRVVKEDIGGYHSLYQGLKGKPFRSDKWMHEAKWRSEYASSRIWADDGFMYPCGFHLFLTKAAAMEYHDKRQVSYPWYRVIKVKAKNILATGYQDKRRAVVAQQMMIVTKKGKQTRAS